MLAVVALALLADLVGVAHHAPGARPAECGVLPGGPGANVWERAKVPQLRPYCDHLASAAAKLTPGSRMNADAVRLADEAEALVPGRPAAMVLKGRALCQLARYAEAVKALQVARERDPRALDDPAALLAWSRALAFTGDRAGARAAYRLLLPRAEVLPLADRGVAYVGAGVLAMSGGPDALGETIAILRQARSDSQDLLRSAATLLLALALDRSGDAAEAAEAASVLAEEGVREATTVMTDPRVLQAMGRGGEGEGKAVLALALEVDGKPKEARAAWEAYLARGGAGGAWEAHARAHLGARAAAHPAAVHPAAAGHP